MVSPLRQVIDWLDQAGFYEVILPWAFIFAITYGFLHTTKIFGVENGKPKTNINLGVALALSILFLAAKTLVMGLNLFLRNLIVLIIILLGVAMIFGFLRIPVKSLWARWFALILFVGLVIVTFDLLGYIREFFNFLKTPIAFTFYVILFVLFSTLKLYKKVKKKEVEKEIPEVPEFKGEEIEETPGKRGPKKLTELSREDLEKAGFKIKP